MASHFDVAFELLIQKNIEGEISNLKDDSGGITKYGISSRAYPNIDVANITKEDARHLYRNDYWDTEYDFIDSQDVANKIFIAGINLGSHKAHILLQSVLNDMGAKLTIDGKFGPKTLCAINNFDPVQLLDKYTIALIKFYLKLDDQRVETRKASYLRGWVRRALI